MKLKHSIFLLILLFGACDKNNSTKEDSNFSNVAKPDPLNLKEGYITNIFSGDTIQPIINSSGDTVKTGIRMPITGELRDATSVIESVTQKAGAPVIVLPPNNVHAIPENLTSIPVDERMLRKIVLGQNMSFKLYNPRGDSINSASYVLVNSTGDTVKTGIPIAVRGKTVPFLQTKPIKALGFGRKDNATNNFKYLDADQGISSSLIVCFLQDKRGNFWFGTNSGITKYDGISFTDFKETEGLSNNLVTAIFEDKVGNIWIATQLGGVSKYDGEKFTHYTEAEGLPKNLVQSILEDKNGNLWFGTYLYGVTKYDGKTFTHFTIKEGLSLNAVKCIFEDKNGNIWFGTNGGGVDKYDGKSFTHFTMKDGLPHNFVSSILEDKAGNLWFGTYGGGASKYDGKSFTHFTEKEGLISNYVRAMLEDNNGVIWFGTQVGVSKFDGKSFTDFTEKEGLSNNTVFSIVKDNSDNIWFGTIDGVSKYKEASFSHYTESEGLPKNLIESIFEDKNGNLWFGSQGGGVSKYDGKSFVNYTQKEGLCSNNVSSIIEDNDGSMWFTTTGGVSILELQDGLQKSNFTRNNDQTGLTHFVLYNVIKDREGNLWFATLGGVSKYDIKSNLYTNFTQKEGLANNNVWKIIEDKKGNLWFASYGGGISKYEPPVNGQEGNITHYTEKEGLPSNLVRSLFEDKLGNIWFGTDGAGLCMFDGKQFTNYSEKQGLADNNVRGICADKAGNLFVSTKKGISYFVFDKSNKQAAHQEEKNNGVKIINLQKDDGLKGLEFNQNSIIIDSKNRLWLGTHTALEMLDLNTFKISSTTPKVSLKSISINEKFLDYRNIQDSLKNGIDYEGVEQFQNYPLSLKLSSENNYLTFYYVATDWASPHKIKYQFRIDGLNEQWSISSDETKAEYRNIPSGAYTFEVRAIGESQVWSEPFKYNFTILPPFYYTWWAILFYIAIGVSILILIVRWRTSKLKQRQRELEVEVGRATLEIRNQKEVVEEKHKEITDSINYAERIQRSFLATKELLDENLNEHFVFFQPKDIVSGDFYWATRLVNSSGVENFALVTADSTGHGVPGAIMSLLNITSLEKAIENNSEPAEILNSTRKTIIERLKKDGSAEGGKDGMDCSIISFDFKNLKMTYAAANNPIWVVRQNELFEYKADKMPVGKHDKDGIPFTQHAIDLQKGDLVYAITDGMPDQFGGPKGKKFMAKQLKEILIAIAPLPMKEQKEKLAEALNGWKGYMEQVDDVTLVGVRI